MNKDIYCPIIHGGLNIRYYNDRPLVNHCCMQSKKFIINDLNNIWNDKNLVKVRESNNNDIWDENCNTCHLTEKFGYSSYRTGMIDQFGVIKNLSGPIVLDLFFTNNCNLACRMCGEHSSSYWKKHLLDNKLPSTYKILKDGSKNTIDILKKLDLSNLKLVKFGGGEPFLGNECWEVVDYLVKTIPNSEKQLTISFQTNGTMPISSKFYKLIEKCHLMNISISLDAIDEKFEYLRWPAKWNQVTDNIIKFKEITPTNVMLQVEETISVLNLLYLNELKMWVQQNFSTNRLGDSINHGNHLVNGFMSLNNLTNEYVESIKNTNLINLVSKNFIENSKSIKKMIEELNLFDNIRNQDWKKTFPEVAEFYKRYL